MHMHSIVLIRWVHILLLEERVTNFLPIFLIKFRFFCLFLDNRLIVTSFFVPKCWPYKYIWQEVFFNMIGVHGFLCCVRNLAGTTTCWRVPMHAVITCENDQPLLCPNSTVIGVHIRCQESIVCFALTWTLVHLPQQAIIHAVIIPITGGTNHGLECSSPRRLAKIQSAFATRSTRRLPNVQLPCPNVMRSNSYKRYHVK